MKNDGRWRFGFSAKAERTLFFILTLVMLAYGAVVWITGGG